MLRDDKNTKNHNKTPTHTITDTLTDVAIVKLMTDALLGSTEDYRVHIPSWDTARCYHWETSIKNINHWDALNFNYIPETDTFNFNNRSTT
tara:strand:- start:644 stop:916 length:273 start_codon:yes stop_codon:yes gene_type:complete